MSLRGAVEAALFAAGGPISLPDLAQVVGSPTEEVADCLTVLRVEYKSREGGLEIVRHAGGLWVLQVPKQYTHLVTRLVPPDLETPLMRTLSVIALLQPVTQAKVVDRRGQGAYNHVTELVKRGFVLKEPEGNSFLLKTTPEFARRFRLKDDPEAIRTALKEKAEITPDAPQIEPASEPLSAEAIEVLQQAGETPGVDAAQLAQEMTDALAPLAGVSVEPDAKASEPAAEAAGTPAGSAADEGPARSPEAMPSGAPDDAPGLSAAHGVESAAPATEAADADAAASDDKKITRLADHSSLRQRMLHGNERTIFRIPRKRAGKA